MLIIQGINKLNDDLNANSLSNNTRTVHRLDSNNELNEDFYSSVNSDCDRMAEELVKASTSFVLASTLVLYSMMWKSYS